MTQTRVITETVSSELDRNGNRYHFARFYNPAKGRSECVSMEVGGDSNAKYIAHDLAGGDWEATLSFQCSLPKKEWQRERKRVTLYEGTTEATAALALLFAKEAQS